MPRNGRCGLARVDLQIEGAAHAAERAHDRRGVGHLPGREQLADARLLEHGQLVVGPSDHERAALAEPESRGFGEAHPDAAGEVGVVAGAPDVHPDAYVAEVAHARPGDLG